MSRYRLANAGSDNSGKKPSARTGLMRSTGSPFPTTSYSSVMPWISAVFMTFSPFHAGRSSPKRGRDKHRYAGKLPRYDVLGAVLVSDVGDSGALMQRAHAAASRREWAAAHELFAEAAKAGVLLPRDRPLVAEVAYAAGHLDATIETWEE